MFQYVRTNAPHILLLQEMHLMGRRIYACRKPWVQKVFHATYSNFSRGVSVLVSKALLCVVDVLHMDPLGKFVVEILSLWGLQYIIVNVYVPPTLHSCFVLPGAR